jgi:hypothetical protein
MNPSKYLELKNKIIGLGYGSDIDWSENVSPPNDPYDLLQEYIFVVCNSGMKAQIAVGIFNRIIEAIINNIPIWLVFKNFHKVNAINHVYGLKNHYFNQYLKSSNVLEFCESLPYMGETIKYHLAKNLGFDCIKPDRHLVRISKTYGMDPFTMCGKLSEKTGDSLNTVDTVIWRAANQRIV